MRALPERAAQRLRFPRVIGYRWELPSEKLSARFDASSELVLSTKDTPTQTELSSIIGESEIHTLDHLRGRRENEVAFWLAKRVLGPRRSERWSTAWPRSWRGSTTWARAAPRSSGTSPIPAPTRATRMTRRTRCSRWCSRPRTRAERSG